MDDNNPEEIKKAVLNKYGSHARERLAAGEQPPDDTATAPCCGPAQPAAEEAPCSCCAPSQSVPVDRAIAEQIYSTDDLKDMPEDVLSSLGCGNPTAIAGLHEGESVLDLGSGGGLDCFLAAKKVGSGGSVVGLDMSADMIQLARRNARQVGADNVRFRLGEMEDLPFPDGSFDVIISNCVINLSPDKDAVLRECYRILKPGGRLRVSDIVWSREPSEKERSDLASWTECVAGALTEADYTSTLRAAGFQDISVERKGGPDAPVVNLFSAYINAEKKA